MLDERQGASSKTLQLDNCKVSRLSREEIERDRFSRECLSKYDTNSSCGDFFIDKLLRERQPCIIGGPKKSCKTMMSAEMAASLLTGTSFLGMKVFKKYRLLIVTLETLISDYEEWITKAFYSKEDYNENDFCNCSIIDSADALYDPEVARGAGRSGYDVIIIDPFYLTTLVSRECESITSLDFPRLVKPFIDNGITPIVCCHFTKDILPGDEPDLNSLLGSGPGQFARSWLLMNRREEYDHSGLHKLIVQTGTRGHGQRMEIDFDEVNWKIETATTVNTVKAAKKLESSSFADIAMKIAGGK